MRSRYLIALTYRDFRTMWIANIASGAASWALIVARGGLVLEMSGSSLLVGLVTFAAMIPRVMVTPLSGYLSDRYDRRSVLASMFAINLVNNLVLAALAISGHIEIWHLVILSFIGGSARATQMPAAQALIPNLIPKSILLNGVALNQATMQGSRLVGPLAIMLLLPVFGAEGAFVLCTGFYLISFLQVLRVKTASTGEIDKNRNFLQNISAGAVYVYKTPTLRAIIFLVLFHCGFTMSYESLFPIFAANQLGAVGISHFNYLIMAVGGGALLSSMTIAGIQRQTTRGKMFFYLGLLSGIAPVILALSSNLPLAMVGAFGMGVSQAGFMTLTHTTIQQIIPDGVRGRIGGIYNIHVGGTMAVINLGNGWLADMINAPLLLVIGGALFVGVMLLSWSIVSLKEIYTEGLPARLLPAAS